MASVAAVSSALLAQPQQPPRPTFRTEANFVRVDAYPTHDGQPIDDLQASDFEVFEEGKAQSIATFEHVVIQGGTPEITRVNPTTVGESRALAGDPRSRVFVIFMDLGSGRFGNAPSIRQPLITLLNRLMADRDLVGLMTPEMSALDLTLSSKTAVLERMIDKLVDRPDLRPSQTARIETSPCLIGLPFQGELMLRRAEKRTIDALSDLVMHLGNLRQERKAIIVVSRGWSLPRPEPRLMQALGGGRGGGLQPIGIDPRTGRLRAGDPTGFNGRASSPQCDREVMALAQVDLWQDFRSLLDLANTYNASFYPIDPLGLSGFDELLDAIARSSTRFPMNAAVDRARDRRDALRTLADNTDGLAVINTNALDKGVRRIVSDLSSYYLLGYYSTNTQLDGRFRRIKVRVNRPGVAVRARRGYRAATLDEFAPSPPRVTTAPVDPAIVEALGGVSFVRRDAPMRVHVARGGGDRNMWVIGELDAANQEWRTGARIAIALFRTGAGQVSETTIPLTGRSFMTKLDGRGLAAGGYTVRVTLVAREPDAAIEWAPLVVPERPGDIGTPVLFRRGPFSTVSFTPTADRRYRRNETLRVQVPIAPGLGAPAIALLDRSGRSINLTMAANEIDADGAHWAVGDLPLAPLAAADYLIQIEAGGQKVVTAFTIVN